MNWLFDILGLGDEEPQSDGFPNSYRINRQERGITHPKVFDPALKHFACGFRDGEPTFKFASEEVEWFETRHRVMQHVLRVVSESKLRDELIIRGSVVMQHWFGERARRPRDLDWLVKPAKFFKRPRSILPRFVQTITDHKDLDEEVELIVRESKVDDIWTYDRAPGQRLVIPWKKRGLPRGFLQLDFVFEEELWRPPVELSFAGFSSERSLLAASKEQSLAWKILWLESDMYPQSKDLYDAVLLAEAVVISHELLVTAWTDNHRTGLGQFGPQAVMDWDVDDWESFTSEYPNVEGELEEWKRRLCVSLKSAFGES